MEKLRLEDAKSFAPGPKARETQVQDMKPVVWQPVLSYNDTP